MPNPPVRRAGGPTLQALWDVVALAIRTRSLALAVLVMAIGVAVALAWVGHAVVPWAIYPAL